MKFHYSLVLILAAFVLLPRVYAQSGSAGESINSISICVDFNNTGTVTLSDGTTVTATASGLDSAQKAAVLAKIKAKYDAVLGAGNVTVAEAGAGGCGSGTTNVVVSGSSDPNRAGNAGKPPGPSIVFGGSFVQNGFTGDTLACAIGETAAHEIGHRLGLSHSCDSNDLMAAGTKVSLDRRKRDKRTFTPGDSTKIRQYTAVVNSEPRPGAFMVVIPPPLPPLSDETSADGDVTFISPLPGLIELGYMTLSNEFIPTRYNTDLLPHVFTFLYPGTYDLAIRHEGVIFPAEGHATIELINREPGDQIAGPDGEAIYRRAQVHFDFNRDGQSEVDLVFVAHDGAGFGRVGGSGVDVESSETVRLSVVTGASGSPRLDVNLVESSDVSLRVYDAMGRFVRELFAGRLEGGAHTFDPAVAGLSSGRYFVRLQAGNAVAIEPVDIVK